MDLFASSGGAVNALALVATHPGDVRTLIAHEPPLASILPDREGALAVCRAIGETYPAVTPMVRTPRSRQAAAMSMAYSAKMTWSL